MMDRPDQRDVCRRILGTAEQLLRLRGWTRGRYVDDHGRMCLLGSLQVATAEEGFNPGRCPELVDVITTLHTAISDPHSSRAGSLIKWNDAPIRTEDEVCELLRQTRGRYAEVST